MENLVSKMKFLLLVAMVLGLFIAVVSLSVVLAKAHNCSEENPANASTPSTAVANDTAGTPPWQQLRLTQKVVPLHYDLLLHPDLNNGSFVGQVTIDVQVLQPDVEGLFIVHAKKLAVKSAEVQRENASLPIDKHFDYPDSEFHVVRLASSLDAGNYSLTFHFEGSLLGDIVGFYRSSYVDSATNDTRYLATTKFEPTYAREAFPCFDEPNFKSTFTVHLVHPEGYKALSNMDSQVTIPYNAGGLMKTSFKPSVPMVTYLVCFIVCDFTYKETFITERKLPFRVYARSDQINFTILALEKGSVIQEGYDKYFDISYPLPKQDMIGIPDFASGAMENWGLITYRETSLLYDPLTTSTDSMEAILRTVAHELTHQWFGNLVTMKWWDDLWLNEGFATFFAYHGLMNAVPEWQAESNILIREMQLGFSMDSDSSSHPIVQSVKNPDQINAIFDDIAYKKGASIIRMLEAFMGQKKFRRGIQLYLKKHQYNNAETNDLWEALAAVDQGLNISKIMRTWTEQKGFPVITIHRDGNLLTAAQNRFLNNPNTSEPDESPFGYMWEVPLTYRTEKQSTSTLKWIHMEEREVSFQIPDINEHQWVKFNVDTTGFYRVNYDHEEWKRFIQLLVNDPQVLSVFDRTGLMDDAFALATAGLLEYRIPLQLLNYLKNETAYEPWVTATKRIRNIGRLLQETSDYRNFRKRIIEIVNPVYNQIGWEDIGSNQLKKLRMTILDLACWLESSDCLQKSKKLFNQWIADPNTLISPNIINVVYNYGMKTSSPETWDIVWERYLEETSAQRRINIMKGLASTSSPWLLNSLLDSTMNESLIRSQDAFTVVTNVAHNPIGRPLAWNFFRSQWEALVERFTLNNRHLGTLILPVASWFTSENQLKDLRTFFTMYPDAGAGQQSRRRVVRAIKNNIRWLQNYRIPVRNWLEQDIP